MPATLIEAIDRLDSTERSLCFTAPGPPEEASRTWNYRELREDIHDLARRLLGAGFRAGDRIVLMLIDQADFALLFLASVRAGLLPVPVYPPTLLAELAAHVEHVERVRRLTGARGIVVSDDLEPMLRKLAPEAPLLPASEIRSTDPRGELTHPRPSDVAFLQFSSGSTASPKGVAVTHRNLLANVAAIVQVLELEVEDRGVSWLPLYHDMGLIGFLLTPLVLQASTWYLPPLEFVRQPLRWLSLLDRVRGTVSFAPNFAYGLVNRRLKDGDAQRWDLSRWRVAGCGAEPIDERTLERFCQRLAPAGFRKSAVVACYGLAESTLAVSASRLGRGVVTAEVDAPRLRGERRAEPLAEARGSEREGVRLVSCGRPVPGSELRIVDAAGRTLPERCEGEIAVRGESVAAGYWNEPERNAESFRGGWLHTGDQGFVLDGELFVTGRIKDLIILNGRNYHPHDIESRAAEVPGVRRGNVVAFSRPGASGEELVIAVETLSSALPCELTRSIRSRVRSELGLPVSSVVTLAGGTIPKTSSGKLRRRETRARFLAGRLGQPAAQTEHSASSRDAAPRSPASARARIQSRSRGDEEEAWPAAVKGSRPEPRGTG